MTSEYRKTRLAHFRAYDIIYRELHGERKNLFDRERYWLDPSRKRAAVKRYYEKNREKVRRRQSTVLCADEMIREALA